MPEACPTPDVQPPSAEMKEYSELLTFIGDREIAIDDLRRAIDGAKARANEIRFSKPPEVEAEAGV